jgi:hypothetical protein
MHFALEPWPNQQEAVNAAANPATAAADIANNWSQVSRTDAIAQYVYFVRICNEWEGNPTCGPFVNGNESNGQAIDPATWSKGIIYAIQSLRADPNFKNIKIAIDAPIDAETDKYALPIIQAGVVDLLAWDLYLGNGGYNDGSSPNQETASWHGASTNQLAHINNLSVQYKLPMVFPEWCDGFDTGNNMTRIANWFNTHNVVAAVYWDDKPYSTTGPEVGCQVDFNQSKLDAYTAAFANHQYGGTYWSPVIPWPNIVTWSPRSTQSIGQKVPRRIFDNHR